MNYATLGWVALVGAALLVLLKVKPCSHARYSMPQTPKDKSKIPAAQQTGTYVVCLDCGKEFPYDWSKMVVVQEGTWPATRLHTTFSRR